MVAVRGFHKFAVADGLAAADPASGVKPPAPAKRLPKALPLADVEAILEAAGAPGTTLALRDRALLEVLYGTGARISEAVGLDVDDLDTVDGTVLLRGKGGKERIVPVGSYALRGGRRLPGPRPARAGRRGQGHARRCSSTPAAAGSRGSRAWAVLVQGRRAGRRHPRRLAAHPAALLRHPPARRRRRRPRRAGAARPRVGDDHAGLHAGHRRQPARGLRHRAPAGPRTDGPDVRSRPATTRRRLRRGRRLGGGAGARRSTRTRTRRSSSCSAGRNVMLATPTGSGKSLVAVGGARRGAGRRPGHASTPRRSRRW